MNMDSRNFLTELNSIAGTYPAGVDSPADQRQHRDRIDYVFDSTQADILNDRNAWKRFTSAPDKASMRGLVDERVLAKVRQIGLVSIPKSTQAAVTTKLLDDVWDVWHNEEGASN